MPGSDNRPEPDRSALAHEVIVSAGNVLRAAGFARGEIAAMFTAAAAALGGPPAPPPPPTHAAATVRARFAGLPHVRELAALAREGAGLLPLGADVAALKPAFDLAMRLAPLLAEAQEALRTLAAEARLPLAATRAEAGEGAICLEDCAEAYAGAFALVAALVDALLAAEDAEAFAFLLGHYAENGVVVSGPLQDALARGARLLG